MKRISLINHDEPALVDDEDYEVFSQFTWEAAWGENFEVVGALRWIDDPKNDRLQYGVFMQDEVWARMGNTLKTVDVLVRRVGISVTEETLPWARFLALIFGEN